MLLDRSRVIYSGNYVDEIFLRQFSRKDIASAKNFYPARIFRSAVYHQSTRVRQRLIKLGFLDLMEDFSLDHHPVHFSSLKWVFLKLQGINPYKLTREDITVELLRDWQCFHGALAEYRPLTLYENRVLGRSHFAYCSDVSKDIG
jgi:hypothetical protein